MSIVVEPIKTSDATFSRVDVKAPDLLITIREVDGVVDLVVEPAFSPGHLVVKRVTMFSDEISFSLRGVNDSGI